MDGDRQHGHRRDAHTATLLPSGKVLVAGGYWHPAIESGLLPTAWMRGCDRIFSAELYDPASGTWTVDRQHEHRTL